MFNKKIVATIAAVGSIAGCVSIYPNVDQQYGEAVRAATRTQTLNPRGTPGPKQASGIDGMAAKETMDRYVKSFKEPPPPINVINIGGALGTQEGR